MQPASTSNPSALAVIEGARSVGIPTFDNQNGRLMESARGSSIIDLRVRAGRRQSIFRSYVFPILDEPNLSPRAGLLYELVSQALRKLPISKPETRN